MKICRFQPLVFEASPSRGGITTHPDVLLGRVEQNQVRQLDGDLFAGWKPAEKTWPIEQVKFLPPSVPSKIVCVGRNYREHAAELGNDMPTEPLIFLKPPSAIIAPEEAIVMPAISKRVDYEGEIAIIIGRPCSQLADTADVRPYIAGFTCLNDVTARDLQKTDGQWTRAKGFDTFCPFGPVLETELDLAATTIETFVNGQKKQSSRASEMIFSVDVIIRWISRVMTLLPGDVIATGTPSGIGPLASGDLVEVTVGGVGTLRNRAIASDS
ncbi:MAG TPA: fumarylacetoacetate hydrolase family protein [Candidatus Acidoferrales bacterium]|nr:fumarylacetoacetate hydrolase family protein [Candidatus Acidoferrales bacterium]